MARPMQTLPDDDIEAIVRRASSGNSAAFAELYDAYAPRVRRFLRHQLGDDDLAEDLLQRTFVKMIEALPRYHARGLPFGAWVFRIARNARNDHFRRAAPVEPLLDDALEHPTPEPGPAAQLELERDACRLRRALSRLRDDRRELIALARYEGLKHEQIAEILGVGVGTVKVRLHRALIELRDVFHTLPEGTTCTATTRDCC